MAVNYAKAPFPWFGGKSKAAPILWAALGDVAHYVEPFAGSLGALLLRPHLCNRPYYSETVNDLDGFLVNAWRSIQLHPDETAEAASWPVSECDLHARHLWLLRWKAERDFEKLMGDPAYCDPQAAGWWLWGQSSWIGSGWCRGDGCWTVGADGRLTKGERAASNVAKRQRPHLGDDGRGVNRQTLRAPGVARQLPHLVGNGQGVNHAGVREAGIAADSPAEWTAEGFHPMTMPELRAWFASLSARLRHTRILCGDWKRAVTNGASKTLSVRGSKGSCGIFVDPPYADTATRTNALYAQDSLSVAHEVRAWAAERGSDPETRIVLAGFDTEHAELEAIGWRCVEWFKAGFLSGGMGNTSKTGKHQQKRERLWLSPHCLAMPDERPAESSPRFVVDERQLSMLEAE